MSLQQFKELTPGAIFYLDRFYRNTYRKVDNKTSEFVAHRHTNAYVGHRLTMAPSQAVRRESLEPDTLSLLGIDPEAEPWMGAWVPPAGWELLGDEPAPKRRPAPRDEDLLGTFPPPECPQPRKSTKAKRRAARKIQALLEADLL